MPIWKITPQGPVKVAETTLAREKLLEEHIEDWIAETPNILEEPLLIIGRQVLIPDVKDKLDLLAIDPEGKAVIIELKRGKLKDPVDMQALRYASYVSKWKFEDFERVAAGYLGKGDPEFNFNALYEKFCTDAEVDEIPDLNSDQRMIVVGAEVKEKLGSVALWLRQHDVDIKVFEVDAYREDSTLFLQPQRIVPHPVSAFADTGGTAKKDTSQPWTLDGRTWHLEKRCGPQTREMLVKLDNLVEDNFQVEVHWNQKQYVAFRVGSYSWLAVGTHPTVLSIHCHVKAGTFEQTALAKQLGVQEFDRGDSLAEKLSLGSSVAVQKRTESTDKVVLRIKEDFDLDSEQFLRFLQQAHKGWPKH